MQEFPEVTEKWTLNQPLELRELLVGGLVSTAHV